MKKYDAEFLNVPLGVNTIPFYTARRAILEALNQVIPKFRGRVLDVGCGHMPYRPLIEANSQVSEYLGMDIVGSAPYAEIEPHLTWDGLSIPLEGESIDVLIATEFLEHVSDPERVLIEMYRVLRPNGTAFATVPFIWNLHEIPHDEYRYTPFSIRRHFENAGFKNIEIQGLGGWNLSLAQMIGLWLVFSDISPLKRKILKRALYPFYVWLIKTDKKPVEFDGWSNSMFTGLSIVASK